MTASDDIDESEPQRPTPEQLWSMDLLANRGYKSWLALSVLMAGTVAFFLLYFLPLLSERNVLDERLEESQSELVAAKEKLHLLETQAGKLGNERDRFAARLSVEVEEKRTALEALKRTQDQLSTSLEREIAKGDIMIENRDGQLVLDVSDKLLFAPGDAEISEQGKRVLFEVAKTLHRMPRRRVQVGGHTDSTRVVSSELRDRYPTNWELSTARATNVVRYLQEKGGVPGNRLIAAGFSHFEPVASNRSKFGRERNRRIEITLLKPPKPAGAAESKAE